MALARKMAVSVLKKSGVPEKIMAQLQGDAGNGYTIAGLMMDCYNVKENDINKSFRLWKAGMPTLYTQIRLSLEKMVKSGQIEKTKKGRAVYYWWAK